MSKIELVNQGYHKTIKKQFVIKGPSPYAVNTSNRAVFKPARSGIRFIYRRKIVQLKPENNSDAHGVHATHVSANGVTIVLTEHILSALMGMGITACDIELLDTNECPVPDRSSETISKRLAEVGSVETDRTLTVAKVTKEIAFMSDDSFAILRPSEKFEISALLQYKNLFEDQYFKIEVNPNTYINEICWARSFLRRDCPNEEMYRHETKTLLSFPKKMVNAPVMVRSNGVWITGMKPLEPVRHKILDAIGDLSTFGMPLLADVTLVRPGHWFNRKLVQHLNQIRNETQVAV